MIRTMGLIFTGTSLLMCVGIFIAAQFLKNIYSVPPEWLWGVVGLTFVIGIIGIFCAFLVFLGVE